MSGGERVTAAVGAAVEGVLTAAAVAAGPEAVGILATIEAMGDAMRRVIREAEIAKAQGEVVTGEALLLRSAARVAAAAADPGLPPELVALFNPGPPAAPPAPPPAAPEPAAPPAPSPVSPPAPDPTVPPPAPPVPEAPTPSPAPPAPAPEGTP